MQADLDKYISNSEHFYHVNFTNFQFNFRKFVDTIKFVKQENILKILNLILVENMNKRFNKYKRAIYFHKSFCTFHICKVYKDKWTMKVDLPFT